MNQKEISILSSNTEIAKTIYNLPPMTINFTIVVALAGIFVSNNVNEYFIRNLFILTLVLQLYSVFRFFYITANCLMETISNLDRLTRSISLLKDCCDRHLYTEKVLNLFHDFINDGFPYYKKTYGALMLVVLSNCLLALVAIDLIIQMRKMPIDINSYNALGLIIIVALGFYTLANNIYTFLTCISVKLSYKSNTNRATEIIWNDCIKNTNFQ